MTLINLLAWQDWRCRRRERICGRSMGRERWGQTESSIDIYTTVCKTDSYQEVTVWPRDLGPGAVTAQRGQSGREA